MIKLGWGLWMVLLFGAEIKARNPSTAEPIIYWRGKYYTPWFA